MIQESNMPTYKMTNDNTDISKSISTAETVTDELENYAFKERKEKYIMIRNFTDANKVIIKDAKSIPAEHYEVPEAKELVETQLRGVVTRTTDLYNLLKTNQNVSIVYDEQGNLIGKVILKEHVVETPSITENKDLDVQAMEEFLSGSVAPVTAI